MTSKKAKVLWFTGLSGSGKTTIALSLKEHLEKRSKKILILDGDSIRSTINRSLGYTKEDIETNNLIVANVVIDNQNNYDYIIVPIISPYKKHRKMVRELISENFHEIYINSSLDKCIERDVKGLYKRALNGELSNMIGISSSDLYETPVNPNLTLNTEELNLEDSIIKILNFISEIDSNKIKTKKQKGIVI